MRFVELPGSGGIEAALEFREGGRLTLLLNDVVGNLPPSHGLVLRAMGFATVRPRIPRAAKRWLVKDAGALRAQFERWADEPVERVLVSHGRPVVDDAAGALRAIAAAL